MNGKPCKFCAELRELKLIHAENRGSDPTLMYKYNVALESRTFRGSIPGGNTVYHGYKLNYCPECGRSLRKEIRK